MKNPLMRKSILIAIIVLAFFSLLASLYTMNLSHSLYDETNEYLKEIALQTASSINNKINENQTQLETMSTFIQESELSLDETINYFHQVAQKRTEIKRFGIADIDGNAVTSDQQKFNIQTRDYFQKSMQGEFATSSTISDFVDEQSINVHSVPIYNQNNKIDGVLFATFYNDKLANTLSNASFNNNGYSLIFDTTGQIILTPPEIEKDETINSITDLSINKDIQMKDIDINNTGVISFEDHNHQTNYLVYSNVKDVNWLVASIFPKDIVTQKIQRFIQTAFLTWLFIGFGMSALITYVYFIQKKNKIQVAKLAYEDGLTQHYNFNQFIELCKQNKQMSHFVLINCDIKGFKWFNEIYGEGIANELLKTTIECMKDFTQDNELYCRENDDHFALLLYKDTSENIEKRLLQLAHDIRYYFNKKHATSQFYFHFGVYMISDKETDITSAFKKTQYVKNTLKELSQDDVTFYNEDIFQKQLFAQQIEQKFYDSLKNHDFKVYIQPKINLSNGLVHTGEALVRWQHPELGLMSPAQFIPIFEKNGMLEALDLFVLEEILKVLEKWRHGNQIEVCISINVSRSYLFNEGYVDKLLNLVNKYDVLPKQIEIEITETTALNHKIELISILERLRSHHLRIALDDFGSGYSSLNMLKDYPIDVVKVDQEFFRTNSLTQQRSQIIIEEVIELCHKLQIQVVAEGVETKEQDEFLRHQHCDYIQGYYYFQPMPVEEFENMFIKK